jgi:hypothetical protein
MIILSLHAHEEIVAEGRSVLTRINIIAAIYGVRWISIAG